MKKNIEAFIRYHQSKEALAEYTQIGAAAIQLLRLNVSVSNGAKLLGQFVDACDVAHWGEDKRFPDPVKKTRDIGEMLCNQVLVQQISSFDLFSRSIVSDFARFSSLARKNNPHLMHHHTLCILSPQSRWVASPCCNEFENKLGDLISRLTDLEIMIQWKMSQSLQSVMPLFDLARMCRNRIVHGDGIVGSDLEEHSESKQVSDAFANFKKHYARADLPPLPKLVRGKQIVLSPANAIFFGAVLYEFARELNDHVCAQISDKEFVEMAFFYGCLVETHPARTIKHRDAGARIKYFLTSRYLFKDTARIKDASFYLKEKVWGKTGKVNVESTYWKVALARHEAIRVEPVNKNV
ncbi:hypothetical protein H8L32_12075 [Undibacterium sp. CY18W]|uniref:Abi-like protein n=1 Tax=Undibacterium hunanense TaxID=2762292 RepID=A0ABR6ZRQ3_9BURK|nr:hypothetical protein [Undibacterium hunanense]MBC3918218.1 hypothetical protein [Undibacterium hunanense]